MDASNHRGRVRQTLREGGIVLLVSKLLGFLSDRVRIRAAARVIQQRGAQAGLESDLAFARDFSLDDLTIAPLQIQGEIRALLDVLRADPPATIIEIGTAKGGTLFLFTRVAAPDALLISMDLPTPKNPRYGGGNYAPRAPLYRACARERQKIVFLPADSHASTTLERVVRELAGRSVDFLFIDGDHAAEGVRRDYELYAPLVAPGGLIAFHDIVDGPEDAVGGVPEFWRELRETGASQEFVEDWAQGGYGIGLLRKG